MKISYRTHPALKFVESKSLAGLQTFGCDFDTVKAMFPTLQSGFSLIANRVKGKMYYTSQSFIDAYEKAGDRLYESNLWSDIETDDLCLLLPSGQTTVLNIQNDTDKGVLWIIYTDFHKDIITGFGNFTVEYNKESFSVSDQSWHSLNVKQEKHVLNCALILLFIKYSQVEIKDLMGGQRLKGIECKYVNETKSKVQILNSSWFTTLVKSDGFKVRGHFRLQPKKHNGKWTRELIWINEFEKKGYTAPARKLKDNNAIN